MPSLQNLEKFKRELNSLGGEPDYLRAKGERLEDVEPPSDEEASDSGGSPDLGLSSGDLPPRPGAPRATAAAGSGLADLERPAGRGGPSETPSPEESEEPSGDEGVSEGDSSFFLDDFLKEEGNAEESELTSVPGLVDFGEPASAEPEPQAETSGSESVDLADFGDIGSLGEKSSGDPEPEFGTDLPEPEPVVGDPEPDSPAVASGDASDDDLFFTVPTFDEPTPPVTASGPSGDEAAEESLPSEAFDEPEAPAEMTDFGDFGSEELPSNSIPEESPAVETGFELPPEFALDEPPAAAGSDDEPLSLPEAESAAEESATGFELSDDFTIPDEPSQPGLGDVDSFDMNEDPAPPPRAQAAPRSGRGASVDPELDDFNLGDIGGVSEAAEPAGDDLGEEGAPGTGASDLQLSERDFRALQATMAVLPQNLRLPIEELIGERGLSGPQLKELVELLVKGAPPREIAALTGRLVGRRIVVPAEYRRRTGLEFEEEKDSFAYRFRHNFGPIVLGFLAGSAIVALLVFVGVRFVYRPTSAYLLYRAGYRELQDERYVGANSLFDRAARLWPMRTWYFRYADAFIQKQQKDLAAEKYQELLDLYPNDKQGLLAYADLASRYNRDYATADKLIHRILDQHMYDREGLLAAGDNYLAWGDEDSAKYEDARREYATLLQKYGVTNQILFRLLRAFIRQDRHAEVINLEQHFQANKQIRVDPVAYAELGGYLIDHNELDDVRDILLRARDVNPNVPEIHYNLARYFLKTGDDKEELEALQNTQNLLLFHNQTLTTAQLGMLIDSYGRLGENSNRSKRYLDAENAYRTGIKRYEAAISQNLVQQQPQFGKLYADLGDLDYYQRSDFDEALSYYETAESNDYTVPDLKYKEGYISYRQENFETALKDFYAAAGDYSNNVNLLYATANTLYKRNDLFAAEGYYAGALDILQKQRASIDDFSPSTREDHHDLLTELMMTYNNLGVTLNQVGKRSEDSGKFSQALVELTRSMEAFDQLTRNPVTLQATNSINLAVLNTKDILIPIRGYQLQIYADLPNDMEAPVFPSAAP